MAYRPIYRSAHGTAFSQSYSWYHFQNWLAEKDEARLYNMAPEKSDLRIAAFYEGWQKGVPHYPPRIQKIPGKNTTFTRTWNECPCDSCARKNRIN